MHPVKITYCLFDFEFIKIIFKKFRGEPGEKGDSPAFETYNIPQEEVVGPHGRPGAPGEKGDKGSDGRDGVPGEAGV